MITILCIGKNKEKALRTLEDEYIKRIRPFSKIEVIEVKDQPNQHIDRDKEVDQIKAIEAQRVLDRLDPQDHVILLDLHGQMMDSLAFSDHLKKWTETYKRVVFVIAGSLGPHKSLCDRANERWKLSDLTFTHLMTRILILEQIYRGYMIQNGRSYHK